MDFRANKPCSAVVRGWRSTVRTTTEVWFCHVSAVVDQSSTGEPSSPARGTAMRRVNARGSSVRRLEVQDGVALTMAAANIEQLCNVEDL
jgi:hypothetical protein